MTISETVLGPMDQREAVKQLLYGGKASTMANAFSEDGDVQETYDGICWRIDQGRRKRWPAVVIYHLELCREMLEEKYGWLLDDEREDEDPVNVIEFGRSAKVWEHYRLLWQEFAGHKQRRQRVPGERRRTRDCGPGGGAHMAQGESGGVGI